MFSARTPAKTLLCIVDILVGFLWDMAQNQYVVAWDKAGPLSVAAPGSHENRARGPAVGPLGWKHIIMVVKLTSEFFGLKRTVNTLEENSRAEICVGE